MSSCRIDGYRTTTTPTSMESMTGTLPAPPHAAPTARRASVRPGLAVVALAVAVSLVGHLLFPVVSPLVIAIVAGLLAGNLRALGARHRPGLTVASRTLLRVGVALLGLQLVFGDILALGPWAAVLIVATVASSIGVTLWVGARLGLSPAQRLLIACGTSICGAAAVAAADSVIAPRTAGSPRAAGTAVVTVVLFGTLLLGAIPPAVHLLGLSPETAGIWAGLAIHEVAQTVAAGSVIGSGALAVAVVVKLGRVLMLAPVLAVISVRRRRAAPAGNRPPIVPLFVLGFLGCMALASSGAVPTAVLGAAGHVQLALLSAGMFALGTGVRLDAIREAGPRPFVLGGIGTAWIAAIGLAGAVFVG